MKYILLVPVIAFILFSCKSEKQEEVTQSTEQNQVKPNDVLVQYYGEGLPKYSQEFLNGIKHGTYKHWFKNGVVHTNGQYYMGMRNGTWQWFDEKGAKTLEVNYGNSMARL